MVNSAKILYMKYLSKTATYDIWYYAFQKYIMAFGYVVSDIPVHAEVHTDFPSLTSNLMAIFPCCLRLVI